MADKRRYRVGVSVMTPQGWSDLVAQEVEASSLVAALGAAQGVKMSRWLPDTPVPDTDDDVIEMRFAVPKGVLSAADLPAFTQHVMKAADFAVRRWLEGDR